jgi:hypothetical protein
LELDFVPFSGGGPLESSFIDGNGDGQPDPEAYDPEHI